MNWQMMAVELGSERLCRNHTRQFLYLLWHLKFNRRDGRRCAELALSSLTTQTIALDGPTQVDHSEQCRSRNGNNLVDDHRRSRTIGARDAIVLLRPPRNRRMRSLSARDIALRAEWRSLLRGAGKGVAVAVAAVRRCRLRHCRRHRHLNHRHLQNQIWNRRPE